MQTLIVVILLIATSAWAADRPGEQFTRPLGFPLVVTQVGVVQRELGAAPISEAGHHERIVCYVWPAARVLVTFMSDAESITGRFTMRELSGPAPAECPPVTSPVEARHKLDVGGLRIGMSRREFERVVGPVSVRPDGSVAATFQRTESIDRAKHPHGVGDTLYVEIVVSGRFAHGHLVEVSIRKTMST